MLRCLIFIAVAATASKAKQCSSKPSSGVQGELFNDKCYFKPTPDEVLIDEAEKECKAQQGKLPRPANQEEQDALHKVKFVPRGLAMMGRQRGNGQYMFLDRMIATAEGKVTWWDGAELTWDNFHPSTPKLKVEFPKEGENTMKLTCEVKAPLKGLVLYEFTNLGESESNTITVDNNDGVYSCFVFIFPQLKTMDELYSNTRDYDTNYDESQEMHFKSLDVKIQGGKVLDSELCVQSSNADNEYWFNQWFEAPLDACRSGYPAEVVCVSEQNATTVAKREDTEDRLSNLLRKITKEE